MTTVYRPLQESVFSTAAKTQLFPALWHQIALLFASLSCFFKKVSKKRYHQILSWLLERVEFILIKKYGKNVTRKTSNTFALHHYITLKRGKTIITKNYTLLCRSISSFCLVFQCILQNDGLFRSFYIQQEKAQNEDKLKQFTYLPAIKNMVLQHDCYAVLCKFSRH